VSRSLPTGAPAALAAPHVAMFLLLELQLDAGTVYLASTAHDIDYAGDTYIAAQGIGTIEPVAETDTGARGLAFTLSAAAPAAIAGALQEDVQGRKAILKLGIIDGATVRVDPNVWTGYLDVMTVTDSNTGPVIRVTAEHAMLSWQQPSGVLFSHQDQLAIDDTDLFFEFAAPIAESTVVWPTKEALV